MPTGYITRWALFFHVPTQEYLHMSLHDAMGSIRDASQTELIMAIAKLCPLRRAEHIFDYEADGSPAGDWITLHFDDNLPIQTIEMVVDTNYFERDIQHMVPDGCIRIVHNK